MSMRDKIAQKDILLAFESVLKIEYRDKNIEIIKQKSRAAIENAFQVKISSDIYETQNSNRLIGDTLDTFLAQLMECLKSMSLLLSVSMFDKRYGITLADVNYLGFAQEQLLTALRYLQDEVLYEQRKSFLPAMIRNASNIETNLVKRMLTVMFVLEDIGVKEGVSLISQYLYLGAK